MLDFAEVGRRIGLRMAVPASISHVEIVSPIIGQLMDPEYSGEGVLLTQRECIDLAATIERQAQLLDASDGQGHVCQLAPLYAATQRWLSRSVLLNVLLLGLTFGLLL